MDKFFNILKKGIVFGTVLVFAFVFTYVPQHFNETPQAHALDFDTDIVANISTAVSAAANVSLTTKDTVLDAIAYAIAKTIISSIIGSMINWINSGFKGSPAFVQDLKRNLLEVADRAAGEFIRNLGGVGSFICSPFQLDIQIALSAEYQQSREEKPIESCTLTGIVNNIEDFYNGVSAGGLEDWITITQNPEAYTPYGQLLTARSAMRVKLANEQGQTLTEINWGQGFLSGKICEAIEGPSGSKESCSISKPGQTIANSLNKALGAGQDQLVAADEINELIGALIGQLASQAITGAAGLLGLSSGTSYTYSGFNGGSYVNAAVAQSSNTAGNSAGLNNVSAVIFSDSLQVQRDIVTSANGYITRLNNYANNSRNASDRRSQARVLAQNAVNIRDNAIALQSPIATILTEYQALDVEKANANTTSQRKLAIAQRQAELYSEFTKLNAYTRAQLKDFEETWLSGLL
ncbi:MAG: hypothetical protein KBC62_02925 [Candidatus Pacebacteria bacterium]|nr:hypothetical protein [Candidatus Paceibacterota bacterium]MBP9842934.1 hypothetical protein [Candidatus Paceibacterota bacterium]